MVIIYHYISPFVINTSALHLEISHRMIQYMIVIDNLMVVGFIFSSIDIPFKLHLKKLVTNCKKILSTSMRHMLRWNAASKGKQRCLKMFVGFEKCYLRGPPQGDLVNTSSRSSLPWCTTTDQGLQSNFRVHPEAQSECCGGQLRSTSPLLNIVGIMSVRRWKLIFCDIIHSIYSQVLDKRWGMKLELQK